MQVIVLSKKKVIALILICLLIAAAIVAAILVITSGAWKEETVPTMAQTEVYELSTVPYLAKEVPVYAVAREDKAVALTIDAAWDADKTATILDTLDQYGIKATFFLCGVWVKAYPNMVKEIAEHGHVIGNHSMTHPHMNRLSEAEIERELNDLDNAVYEITGTHTTLFRAPFGEYNDTVVQTVRRLGYEVVQWDVDSVDWKEGRSEETILQTIRSKMKNGSIILCHNNGYHIETYLPKLIEDAKAQGYAFVTIPELLPDGERVIDGNGLCKAKQ